MHAPICRDPSLNKILEGFAVETGIGQAMCGNKMGPAE
ncbi:Hypothetical protein NGK_1208 [Neisseria gonorrhoeae NCCP11945]|uniref:Uncharacterized protein n=1 Tax=Neisseria gonorrhoeae (strain NCCP11945) TaxID=521006 RepID=B4RM48_NEIG2|nr:Hypothetical protein NGK_1208 [Neisseria gonorrhoeae NCCP11945]